MSAKTLTPSDSRESKHRRERFFALSLDMLCVTGFDGYFKDLNPVWEQTLGFTVDELMARPVIEFVHPEDREATCAAIQKLMTGVNVISFENRCVCKDGSYKWILWRTTASPEEQLYYAVARDITERKQMEATLTQDQDLLHTLMDNVPDHVYFKDAESRFIRINKALADWFELNDPDEAVGKSDIDFFAPEHAQQAYIDEQKVMQSGQPLAGKEEREIWQDGRETWVSTTKAPFYDRAGQIIGTFGISRDITQRKHLEQMLQKAHADLEKQVAERTSDLRATNESLQHEIAERKRAEELAKVQQQQLIQADKMASLGILVSGVAHEINNPDNFIMLNAKILSRVWNDAMPILQKYYEEKGDFVLAGVPYTSAYQKIVQLISGISEGADRIQKIVQSLRDFARQDTGDLNQQVDINLAVESAVVIVNNLIQKSTDHFSVALGSDLPTIQGNAQQLEQVLINLITNSCQALGDKAKSLLVSTSYDPHLDRVIIRVHDAGKGIYPDDLKHIIEPFFTTKRDIGGTGLGLSVSYNIVKNHAGALNFASEPGKGTTATVTLPVRKN